MRAPSRRPGATVAEILIAAVVLTLVLAGAWFVFYSSSWQGRQVLTYSNVLEAAASIQDFLRRDLEAMVLPAGAGVRTGAVRLSADGRTLRFLRTMRVADPQDVPAGGPPREFVSWSAERGDEGYTLRRVDSSRETTWRGVRIEDMQFSVLGFEDQTFVVAEFLLVDQEILNRPPVGRLPFPLRILQCLDPPSRFGPPTRRPFPTLGGGTS